MTDNPLSAADFITAVAKTEFARGLELAAEAFREGFVTGRDAARRMMLSEGQPGYAHEIDHIPIPKTPARFQLSADDV